MLSALKGQHTIAQGAEGYAFASIVTITKRLASMARQNDAS